LGTHIPENVGGEKTLFKICPNIPGLEDHQPLIHHIDDHYEYKHHSAMIPTYSNSGLDDHGGIPTQNSDKKNSFFQYLHSQLLRKWLTKYFGVCWVYEWVDLGERKSADVKCNSTVVPFMSCYQQLIKRWRDSRSALHFL